MNYWSSGRGSELTFKRPGPFMVTLFEGVGAGLLSSKG
jgi:hypothetical protein